MSSVILTPKVSQPAEFLYRPYLLNQDEPEGEQKPDEKPTTEQKHMWKPEGYTPTRPSWYTLRGRIKRYLS